MWLKLCWLMEGMPDDYVAHVLLCMPTVPDLSAGFFSPGPGAPTPGPGGDKRDVMTRLATQNAGTAISLPITTAAKPREKYDEVSGHTAHYTTLHGRQHSAQRSAKQRSRSTRQWPVAGGLEAASCPACLPLMLPADRVWGGLFHCSLLHAGLTPALMAVPQHKLTGACPVCACVPWRRRR